MVVHVCDPNVIMVRREGETGEAVEACEPASLEYRVASNKKKKFSKEMEGEEQPPGLSSDLYTSAMVHMHLHLHTEHTPHTWRLLLKFTEAKVRIKENFMHPHGPSLSCIPKGMEGS